MALSGSTKTTKRRCTTSRCKTKTTKCPRCPPAARKASSAACIKFIRRHGEPAQAAAAPNSSAAPQFCCKLSEAQKILAEKYNISSDVWSVTSYTELRREAQECRRWNLLHPTQPPRVSYIERALEGVDGPCISASDYVRTHAEQISPWVPGGLYALGTDGMGRSESRGALRRHFEVDAEMIVLATLYQLKSGK